MGVANVLEALLLTNPHETNFLPCPSLTLFADPAPCLGLCGVCQTTELALHSSVPAAAEPPPPDLLAILPCGHIGCLGCLAQCLATKPQCPFCRRDLAYELCRHRMAPRVVTRETLFSLPATLPMGGAVPAQCRACRVATNRATNESVLRVLAQGLQTARDAYRGAGPARRAVLARGVESLQLQFQMVAEQMSAQAVALLRSQW